MRFLKRIGAICTALVAMTLLPLARANAAEILVGAFAHDVTFIGDAIARCGFSGNAFCLNNRGRWSGTHRRRLIGDHALYIRLDCRKSCFYIRVNRRRWGNDRAFRVDGR